VAVESLGDRRGESVDLRLRPLGVEVDAAVREVLDVSGDVKAAGQREDLGSKTDPLDVAGIPDIAMGDMG
jgi:hypothetical protein